MIYFALGEEGETLYYQLRRFWLELFFGSRAIESMPAFEDLWIRHAEKHRAYHTAKHVFDGLVELQKAGVNSPAIRLAFWFHDAIYDPERRDNELRSAQLACATLQGLGFNGALCLQVGELILDTTHTDLAQSMAGRFVSDADMAILGQDWETFLCYEEGIRQEYGGAQNPEKYRLGRLSFLRNLAYPIFQTRYFNKKYEITAQENIRKLIAQLENPQSA